MCLAQGHNAVTLVRLNPWPLSLKSCTLPLSHCAPDYVGYGCLLVFSACNLCKKVEPRSGQAKCRARPGSKPVNILMVETFIKPHIVYFWSGATLFAYTSWNQIRPDQTNRLDLWSWSKLFANWRLRQRILWCLIWSTLHKKDIRLTFC